MFDPVDKAADSEPVCAKKRSRQASVRRALPSEGFIAAAPSGPREGRPYVWVVDDDELNLSTFRRAFRREFEITCASSGVQALGLLGDALFDVALVDFAMLVFRTLL